MFKQKCIDLKTLRLNEGSLCEHVLHLTSSGSLPSDSKLAFNPFLCLSCQHHLILLLLLECRRYLAYPAPPVVSTTFKLRAMCVHPSLFIFSTLHDTFLSTFSSSLLLHSFSFSASIENLSSSILSHPRRCRRQAKKSNASS